MLSDDRLAELINDFRFGTYVSSDEVDIYHALTELAQYRGTFAKLEEMLKAGAINFGLHGKQDGGAFEAVLFHYGVADARQFSGTPFAALSALADSIIREELERKDAK